MDLKLHQLAEKVAFTIKPDVFIDLLCSYKGSGEVQHVPAYSDQSCAAITMYVYTAMEEDYSVFKHI